MDGFGIEPAAAGLHRRRQPGEIFGRMESSLVGEAQAAAAVEAGDRRAVRPLDLDAEAPARFIFFLQVGDRPFLGRDQIAVQPPEIGLDPFVAADRLDAIDRGDLALIVKPRFLLAAHLDQLGIEVVELGREVGGRPGGHAAADAAAVDDHHRSAGAAQLVGGRQAGNARADDHDVAGLVGLELRRVDRRSAVHPVGLASLVADIHADLPLRMANGLLWETFPR
jgi:hypothetical protein